MPVTQALNKLSGNGKTMEGKNFNQRRKNADREIHLL